MTETFDELMAVYEGREGRGVVFQPRIKHWYDVNLAAGTLPKKYQGMYVDEVYQDLGVTPREVWGPGALARNSRDIYPCRPKRETMWRYG
jgi:hypothetical protein